MWNAYVWSHTGKCLWPVNTLNIVCQHVVKVAVEQTGRPCDSQHFTWSNLLLSKTKQTKSLIIKMVNKISPLRKHWCLGHTDHSDSRSFMKGTEYGSSGHWKLQKCIHFNLQMMVAKKPSQESEIFFLHNIFEYLIFACVFSLKNGTEG